MKIKISTALIFMVAFITGTALLWTSQRVQTAERALRDVSRDVAAEEDALRVLAAEWSFLNRPDRLEILARDYLDMKPPQPKQIHISSGTLPQPSRPTLPRHKPELNAIPASLAAAPASSLPPEQTLTSSPQPDRDSFQALLHQLEEETQ